MENEINSEAYKLARKDFVNFVYDRFDSRKDDITKLTNDLLDEILEELKKHIYTSDNRFYTYGRRDFLQKEIDFYLDNNQLVDAFINFYQYIEADTWIDLAAIPEGLNVQEVLDNDYKYKEDGIICEQEKNKIIEIINALKNYLECKEFVSIFDNNKKDNIYGIQKEREIKLDDGTVIGREYYIDSDNDIEESNSAELLDEISKIFDNLFPTDENADS